MASTGLQLCLSVFALLLIAHTSTVFAKQYKVCPGKPADIVFIIDESSSIWPVHYRRQREFIANLTDSFDVGPDQTRIAAVTFANRPKLRFGFNDHEKNEDVRAAVEKIDQKTGGTRTDRALKFVRHKIFQESQGDSIPKIAVLLTDGASWYPAVTVREAENLRRHNVTIFTVAISNKINWDEIESIASEPLYDHIFSVDSFDDLGQALVTRLVTSTCKVLGNPAGVCDISFKTDVVFVLGSASQNPYGALRGMHMIENIISDENIFVGPDSVRVGVVPQGCQLDLGFDLDTYGDKAGVISHLSRRKQSFQTAADHLDYMLEESFKVGRGDREEVRNLAVLIMDRSSPFPELTIAAAQRAKDAGIEVVVVAIGKNVNDEEITKIASQPTGNHRITLSDYTEEVDLKHKLYSIICP